MAKNDDATKKPNSSVGFKMNGRPEFPANSETQIIDNESLAAMISDFLKPVIHGYEGCYVHNINGNIVTKLYIADMGEPEDETTVRGIEKIHEKKTNNDILDRITSVASLKRNRMYSLTDKCCELLEKISDARRNNNGDIDWNNSSSEITLSNSNINLNSHRVAVEVSNISIPKVYKHVYGAKNDSNDIIQYDAKFLKPLGGNKFLLCVTRLNCTLTEALAKDLRIIPEYNYSGITPIIR